MKKITTTIFFLIVILNAGYAQDINGEVQWRDAILHSLDTARQDTSRVMLIAELANYYKSSLPDSALFYGYKALALARQIKFPKGEVNALVLMAIAQAALGNDSKALQINLRGLRIAEKNNLMIYKGYFLLGLGSIYNEFKNYTKALDFVKASKALFDSLHDLTFSTFSQNTVGETYLLLNQPDSALHYCQSAYENSVQLKEDWPIFYILFNLGRIQNKKGNMDLALAYFRQSLSLGSNADEIFKSYFSIAQLYQQINKPDSCIYYANKSLELVKGRGFYSNIIKANILLSDIYEKRDPHKALQYSKMAIAYKDSLDNLRKTASLENFIAFDEQERQYEIESAKTAYKNQVKQYVLIAGLMVFLLIAFILYRNNRHKQKAKMKIEKAYGELKSTQSQLIQSEKMASLGELTAGIAHEIQNPLNFVNNFSEVNNELIEELKTHLALGETKLKNQTIDDQDDLLDNILQNNEKIAFHGKRADVIVKGMLQHSRTSSGQREFTDINILADEYLRLAYHGLRAKDKPFNANFETDFDDSIGKINIVPQDIGRVLLNLISNAFYAVKPPNPLKGEQYAPTVWVSTKKAGDKILISVKDNGTGIPKNIVDKIFQPFFTTKPTGQGTGLGLSLAYDIIKAHGGEIKVETSEGEGTEFIILLPVI